MKSQYFGDVGDYGKYGLLRFLAKHGVKIAINWYLTPDDQSNDGSIRGYLAKERDRVHDPELFDVLREMCDCDEKDVSSFANRDMIHSAIYYDSVVKPLPDASTLTSAEKRLEREQWHQQALTACYGAELVFMDPDNGLRAGKPTSRRDAPKYVYASEISSYYDRGQDVVYYCHKGRRTEEQWEKAKRMMLEQCPDSILMGVTYHRGTQRSYIFVLHPEKQEFYRDLLKEFLETEWNECFTEEIFSLG